VRTPILVGLAAGAVLLFALPAAANGRFPQSDQLIFSPTDPNLIVLRTTYGILPSHDNGATWSFVCEDALGISTSSSLADPPIGMTKNSALSVGGPFGLNVSPDVGCNWNCIGGALAGQVIVDLAVRPDDPSSEVALTATFSMPTDGGLSQPYEQVFETNDNGATWSPIGVPIDPAVTVTTVEVSKADPNRIYVSGTRNFGSAETASLFVMNKADAGAPWAEYVLPPAQFDPNQEDSIYVSAVDPTNADRVYIRSRSVVTGGVSRLTVVTLGANGGAPTFTAGKTFVVNPGSSIQLYVGEMLGFALSPDGSKVYVGSEADGLWVAQTSDLNFKQTSTVDIQCLATRGSELWACSAAKYGFIAGVSTDDGKTFVPKLRLIGDLTGPIACASNPMGAACMQSDNSSQCSGPYEMFCLLYTCETDAGSSSGDGGPGSVGDATLASDASRGPASSSSSSCSCDVVGSSGDGAAALGAGLAVLGGALRRRRKAK
jgi:MYXO-CTERM domain-containing protein